MSVKSLRLEKRLAAGLVCATLWSATLVAPAWAEEEQAPERGPQRAALLKSLFNGQNVVPMETPSGQEAEIVEALRLDEAVALALKNNFEIQAAGAKTEAADWDVVGAFASYLPTVTYSQGTGREYSSPADFNDAADNRVKNNTHRRHDKTLTLSQPIVDPALIAEILIRNKAQTAAEIEEVGTRERIAMQTVAAYLQLVGSRLLIHFAEDYKTKLDKLDEQMKSRVEGGGAAQADLDRVKARSVSAQSAIIESRSAYDAAMDEFRRLTRVVPVQLQLPASLLPTTPETIEEALTRALRYNPDYLLSVKQVEVQRGERDKSLSRLLPKLSFEFTRSRTWNAGGVAEGKATTGDDFFPYQNERRAMFVTSWALNGGADIAASLSAGAKVRESNFRSLDTRTRVEQLVRTSYNALNAAQGRVPVLEQSVASNTKVVAAFEEQYQNASRPLFDLLDAYERLYAAQIDLTHVILAEAHAGHQLRQQMGELVTALKASENRVVPVVDPPAPAAAEPPAEAKPEAQSTEPPQPEAAPRPEIGVEPGNGKR